MGSEESSGSGVCGDREREAEAVGDDEDMVSREPDFLVFTCHILASFPLTAQLKLYSSLLPGLTILPSRPPSPVVRLA
jgi:hypothetical protein